MEDYEIFEETIVLGVRRIGNVTDKYHGDRADRHCND